MSSAKAGAGVRQSRAAATREAVAVTHHLSFIEECDLVQDGYCIARADWCRWTGRSSHGHGGHGHGGQGRGDDGCSGDRSEEHTSELQSLMRISYAVFCL